MPRRKTNKEFLEQLNKKFPDIVMLGEYKNNHTKYKFQCKICGTIRETTGKDMLHGIGCVNCWSKQKIHPHKITHEAFEKRLKVISPSITLLSKYIDSRHNVNVVCNECGHVWTTKANTLSLGHGCPNCYRKFHKSLGEEKIARYFDKEQILYKREKTFADCKSVSGHYYPFDFLVNDVLIEYQGNSHDGTDRRITKDEFLKRKEIDEFKKNYAISHGYKFLEIWYKDFNNIEQILKKEIRIHNNCP